MATATFEAGDVVRVRFPYTDRATRQLRPALVVSDGPVGSLDQLLWVVMITAAENSGWPGDVIIAEPQRQTGLPIPSVVRTSKIATVEVSDVERVGQLSDETLATVRRAITSILAVAS